MGDGTGTDWMEEKDQRKRIFTSVGRNFGMDYGLKGIDRFGMDEELDFSSAYFVGTFLTFGSTIALDEDISPAGSTRSNEFFLD